MPVQNINAAFGANFHAEPDPGEIIGGQEIFSMATNEAGTFLVHDIGKDLMLVDIAHEQVIAVVLREGICQVEASSAVGGSVGVIPDSCDVVVDVGVQVRLALLVVDTALNDVEQVGNHTASGESLADIVEVKTPRIRESSSKNLETVLGWVVTPDSTIDELALRFRSARFADHG